MKLRKIAIALTAAILSTGCSAKHLAFKAGDPQIKDAKDRAETIPIFLPRTVLEFRCNGVVTTNKPGKLLEVAPEAEVKTAAEELGIKLNKETKPPFAFSIKDPVLVTRGERDPGELYFIRMDTGPFKKTEFSAQFSSDGVPGLISSTVENKGLEFTVKALEAVASIAGKVISLGVKSTPTDFTGTVKKDTKLLDSIVAQIKKVRKYREDLISGKITSAQVDEKIFVRMLDELSKSESDLIAYFKGTSIDATYPIVVTIRPSALGTSEKEKAYNLFDLSESSGFKKSTDNPDAQLGPLAEELHNETGGAASTVSITLKKPSDSEVEALKDINFAKAAERGLPYRIPARVVAEVKVNVPAEPATPTKKHVPEKNISLIKSELLLAQWGAVNHLPPRVGWPGSTFKPTYYGETGGLKELSVTGTPITPDSLGSIDKATGSITDALKAKSDKEIAAAKELAAKTDELNILKHEADVLEQKVRIQGLQDKLPSSN